MTQHTLKTTLLLFFSLIFFLHNAQTVRTFAGKAYSGNGLYNGTRNNHKDSMLFSAPTGIAIDTAGRIYISNEHNIMLITGNNCKLVAGYNLDPATGGAPDSKDGTGISARFNSPAGLTLNSSTNEILVADVDNHQIRKVSAFFNSSQDPSVSTIAGIKLLNGSYLNSTNSLSKFNGPCGAAIATNGDIFVADRNNHCIRKISGGNVTTIGGQQGVQGHANGAAGTSTFNAPFNVYIEGNTLYVADYGNNAIRKIDISTNITSDFITSGLSSPTALCMMDGALYITEQICIKKYENNLLTLFAGSTSQTGNTDGIGTSARFEYLSGIAYSKKENLLYVVDKGNNTIKSIIPSTRPVCSFTVSNLAPTKGQTVVLKSTSTNKPTAFKWTFTPGSYNLLNNSQITDSVVYVSFTQAGSFTIKLWAANNGGADSLTKNNHINVSSITAAPVASFVASKTNPKVNEIISLIDQSANDPTSWTWRITPGTYIFANGTDSNSRIPNIKFTNGDNYTVTLIATNGLGSTSVTKVNYINVNLSNVNRLLSLENLQLFPNPAAEQVQLSHALNGVVNILNVQGQVVLTQNKQDYMVELAIQDLEIGVYFIVLQTNVGMLSKKLIINR
ncbi:MAG: T9SS type A sorting domain-containing protein [bacterium]|nr:T9SS type A sorting domain-containing protein [bacterium]